MDEKDVEELAKRIESSDTWDEYTYFEEGILENPDELDKKALKKKWKKDMKSLRRN